MKQIPPSNEELDEILARTSDHRPAQPTGRVLQPGTVLEGRLQIIEPIAAGGFGCVYKVRHLLMNKIVALKTLHSVVAASDTMILRLKRESVAISNLNHPNIVQATDFGMVDGTTPYMIMEFVDGPTLAQYLKSQVTLSFDEALQIFIPVCKALAYAHDAGVIHRDIKPSNIMLTKDTSKPSEWLPKLVDFGIAKLTFGEDASGLTLTKTGELFGTPLYMRPEQCAGTGVDHRSDIYSLGCVMFEALTATPPFCGNTALETMMRHANTAAPSLKEASLGKEFPPALEAILAKMLAKDVHDRYQNLYEVANDLHLHSRNEDVDPPVVSSISKSSPRSRQFNSGLVLSVLIAGVALGTLFGIAVANISNSKTTQSPPIQDPKSAPATAVNAVDPGFFRANSGSREFSFPDLNEKNSCLGRLIWWTNTGHASDVPASGKVAVPANANVLFDSSVYTMEHPFNWGRFRPRDLTGIYLCDMDLGDAASTSDVLDYADASIYAATSQQNLSILGLNKLTIRENAWRTVGLISQLKWLWLRNPTIAHNGGIEFAKIGGTDLMQLKNLRNLDTLILCQCATKSNSLASALHAFKDSHLRRLQITGCPMTKEDILAISEIKSLEVLDLRPAMAGEKEFMPGGIASDLGVLATLPRLKKIGFRPDYKFFQSHHSLYNFPHVEKLWIDQPAPEWYWARKQMKSYLRPKSGFDWQKDCIVASDPAIEWFAPDDQPNTFPSFDLRDAERKKSHEQSDEP
jgi:serine/threonine protein kinase